MDIFTGHSNLIEPVGDRHQRKTKIWAYLIIIICFSLVFQLIDCAWVLMILMATQKFSVSCNIWGLVPLFQAFCEMHKIYHPPNTL